MRESTRKTYMLRQTAGAALVAMALALALPPSRALARPSEEPYAIEAAESALSDDTRLDPVVMPEEAEAPADVTGAADEETCAGDVDAPQEEGLSAEEAPLPAEAPDTQPGVDSDETATAPEAVDGAVEAAAEASPEADRVPVEPGDTEAVEDAPLPLDKQTTDAAVAQEGPTLPAAPQKATVPAEGTYVMQADIAADRVIQVKSAKSGSGVVTATYKGGAEQQWVLVREGTSLWYRVLCAKDRALALVLSKDAKGNPVVRLAKAKSVAKGALLKMLWSFVDAGTGACQLVNASAPELRLGVEKASKKAGAKVVAAAAKGSSAKSQRVRMLPASPKVSAGDAVTNGSYHLTLKGASLVAEVDASAKPATADARLASPDGTPGQRIYLERTSDGYYVAWALDTGKALGISGKSILSGTAVRQWAYKGSSRQKWALVAVTAKDGSVSYQLQNKATGLYLGAASAKAGVGLVGRAAGEARRSFTLEGTSLLGEGIYALMPRGTTSVVMQVRKQSTKTARLVLWSENGSLGQRFELVGASGSDLWRIRTGSSGGWLTWQGGSKVVQTGNGKTAASDANTWRAVWGKGGVSLVSVAAEKAGKILALDTSGGRATMGTSVVVRASDGGASQHFRFLPTQLVAEGYYFLQDGGSTYLQVKRSSLKSGAPLQAARENGAYGQLFQVEHVGSHMRIRNAYSGKCLQVVSTTAGSGVVQRPENTSKKQLWKGVIVDGGFFSLASVAKEGLALEAVSGGRKAGKDVRIAAANGSAGQCWKSVSLSDAVNVAKTARQKAVVRSCKTTPSPGRGLCAAWVSSVITNAGIGSWNGDACDLYRNWCTTYDLTKLRPGMIVAVSSHSHTPAGRIWGHVAVYVGGGKVMDNVGPIRTMSLFDWIAWYGDIVYPKWGWLGGRRLR